MHPELDEVHAALTVTAMQTTSANMNLRMLRDVLMTDLI
jgi:hypothetical protein